MKSKFKDGPVVLVSRKIERSFPLSYAYLAGYLREQGEDVRILFRSLNRKELVKQIMALDPVLLGFGNLYPELKEIGYLIKLLNEAGRQFPIIIGGQMVTPIPEFAVKITGADIGVLGEGEIILHQLVTAFRKGQDPSEVKGLVIRDRDHVLLTGPGDYIKDLSQLPSIPYDLFPEEEWLPVGKWYAENKPQPQWRFNDRVIPVHGGRGCPFNCNFCYHHSKPRYRSIPVMISEAAEVLDRYNANMLHISDELVAASPKRIRQLVEEIRKLDKPIEYRIALRFDVLDKINDSLLYDMKESGCRIVVLGLESGSDRILKVIGKNCTATMILNGLERIAKVGMLSSGAVMVGQDTETIEDAEATVDLMRKAVQIDPNFAGSVTIATPFPGTQLYDIIFQKGYLKDHQEFYDKYFTCSNIWQQVVNLSEMTDGEVLLMMKKIKRAYIKEKIKKLGVGTMGLIGLRKTLGITNQMLNKKMFSKFPDHPVINNVSKTRTSIYIKMQKKLESAHLKQAGCTDRI